jgi:HipA-like C-terminal domain
MSVSPRLLQYPDEIVSLDGWQLDDEFPYGPQGAKPKRILICPSPPPRSFLIGGHRYLFKEPSGTHVQQIWSEVIAYELSRDLGLPVPPAFLALGPGNGSPGVLVEFFYGYEHEPQFRFVHAVERLQGMQLPIDYRRGNLRDNLRLCRVHGTPNWRAWWARTLAFDALIGNTDRHTQNWGFLIGPGPKYSLAPAFDNGTSLGYIIREEELERSTASERLKRIVERGRHHFGWAGSSVQEAQHARLCRLFIDRYPDLRYAMDDALRLTDTRIDRLVDWCKSFSFPVPFTQARADFVAAQLRARRASLADVLGA